MCEDVAIAIVGMSCRFAGDATNPDRLWEMLSEGRSAWSPMTSARFNPDGVYHASHEHVGTVRLFYLAISKFQFADSSRLLQTNVKGAHFLKEDIALFDATFFSLSAEAASVSY